MTLLPAPAAFPVASAQFPVPGGGDPMFGVNPYSPRGAFLYRPGASGIDMSIGLPDLAQRAAQQQQMMQMAQLANLGLAPASDPHTWTPEEAAKQTDQAIAKIATVDPAAAERLAQMRAPQEDSGGSFWDSLKHVAGEILAPGLELGGRILDVIGRTANIVPNIAFDAVNGGDFNFFKDVGGALSGETRHNWNSVFQEMGWDGGGIGGFLRATIGLAGDIVTDPLTWILPSGAGVKAAEAAGQTAKVAATHADTIVSRASVLFGKTGTELEEHLSGFYDDVMHGAQLAGWKAGEDAPEIVSGLIGEGVSEAHRALASDMLNIASTTFDGVRNRGLQTWARHGSVLLDDGSKFAGRDLVKTLEAQVRDGNFTGKAIGSASGQWKEARQLASSLGGVRAKVAIPFTSLRYISPAIPFTGLLSEKTLGLAVRFVAGQSGMNRMLSAIGKGEGTVDDLRTWMTQGFNAAFDQNPDLVRNLRGRFHNMGSMFYSASEQMGTITGHLDSGARATRAGLAGYIAHTEKLAAQSVFARMVREMAYEAPNAEGKRLDRQTFLRNAEGVLGVSFRKKGHTATVEQMGDMARYLDWFPQGLDVTDNAALEDWFWKTRLPKMGGAPTEQAMEAAQQKLAHMKEVVGRLNPEQRKLLDHMAGMWDHLRLEAAKRDAVITDIRSNFERAGLLTPEQADEWAVGTHPFLQEDFFIDSTDAGRTARMQYNGVTVEDIGTHDTVAGIHASRSRGGGRGITARGEQVRVRLRGSDWHVIDETADATLSDQERLLAAHAEAAAAAEQGRAVKDAVAEGIHIEPVSARQAQDEAAQLTTEALQKRYPDKSGVVIKHANGDTEVVVFRPEDIKVVSDNAAHLVPQERGYLHRTLTKEAREFIRGRVPQEGRQVLITEPEIEAYLARQTRHMDLDEAETWIRQRLAEEYGVEGLPAQLWDTNVLNVHENYLQTVGNAVQGEMLGKVSRRMVQLGDLAPAMFGNTPRGAKYEWGINPSLVGALANKDRKLTKVIMEAVQKDTKRMQVQQEQLRKTADEYGMFAAMVEESLANGLEVPSRFVQAVRKYGSTRADAQAAIDKELNGVNKTIDRLHEHLVSYDEAAAAVAGDPAYGHPGPGQLITDSITDNPDGTQTIRGWHYSATAAETGVSDPSVVVPSVPGVEMSSNGFHFGDLETAAARAKVDVETSGRTIGWRKDPTTWPKERVETGGLGDPLQFDSFDAYEAASREAGVPVVHIEQPVQPDVFYEDVLFPVETTGKFKGATGAAGESIPNEGPVEKGGIGLTFTGSGRGESIPKLEQRGRLQGEGFTGSLYTNAVEGSGTVSVVVLEPSDVVISNASKRFEEDVAAGRLYRQADGSVSALRAPGSKKLVGKADAEDQLRRLEARQSELTGLRRGLEAGDDATVPNLHAPTPRHRVTVKRQDDGRLVARTPEGGQVVATVRADGDIQVESVLVPSAVRRAGHAEAIYARLAKLADDQGGRLISDIEGNLTPDATALWEGLRRKGYRVSAEDFGEDGGRRFVLQHEGLPSTREVAKASESVARTSSRAAEALGKRQLSAGKKLERLRRQTQLAMTEANKAYAEFHGAAARVKPALVKVETAGNLGGMTRLRVPGLEGYAMPAYMAEEFHHAIDQYGATGLQKAWREYVMGPWKRWATYRWPGFHVRNFFGAFFNNWLGGVGLPEYVFSWRVNHARDGSLKWAARKIDEATMQRFNLKRYFRGVEPTYGDVADLMAEQGIGRANTLAVMGIGPSNEAAREAYQLVGHKNPNAFRRAARKFDGTMRDVGSSVEDFHRVAAWAQGMSATGGDVYGARAFTMMRHGDYSDLTNAEQYIKDVVPFYKWTRTNVPFQLRMLAENPAQLTLVHDKLRRYAFEVQGLDYEQAQLQQPDYMKQTFAIPIPSWVPVVGSKDKDNLKFAMFDLPYADLYNGLGDYMSSTLPIVRNVLESYGFGQTLFSGTPLTGEYKPLSGAFNIPGVRDVLKAAGIAKQGADGALYIDDKLQNVLQAWPIFSRFRNFTESSPERVDARVGGLFSMIAGVGVKQGSYTNAELDFFYNEVQPLLDQYRSLGIQLPTVDDFQSGSVGAHVGLTSAPDVQSPLLAGAQAA